MALINSDKKEVEVKLVYYGPGRAGKTSNLEYIYKKFKKRIKGELASIKTHGDRTLFYDSLPLDIGTVKGYNIKVQLYTIPGQIKYATTKKLVLRGADGIVFVADSMVLRQNLNIASFQDLKENLTIFDKDIFKIPLVFQYNKRDLADQNIPILSYETLEKDLNSELKAPSFEASAIKGSKVIETVKKIISLTVASLQDKL
ncbi:MAG: GTPase domain-containing protein [Deltaproteobacteria bacterium]|nr:GTPase domain-containing protein [Deltaproteobacteria bacterium]HUV78460.1 GTPase domain-containing protein [Desulfobacterales bacterium]MBW1827684.1 GTPase domain-containing protein [Deltaproteobacteria bacterium]MBW1970384.1 GTPase domain-containing protein [Deltaproteobacteria bacterium]MBW2158208.1 GTPase domain-containing protein [Deltaproteobacteria bacterium]